MDASATDTHKDEESETTLQEDDFGLRYRPHLDHFFRQPPSRNSADRVSLKEDRTLDKKGCAHPRWQRENFLGSTYFTCVCCGWRRRQAVHPTSSSLSLQEAEKLFRARYPRRHDVPPREQHNAEVMRQWQELACREKHPAEVAREVSARDMLQSNTYQRVSAQVHATAHLENDVEVLARRYTAALQIFQSRLNRLFVDKARRQEADGQKAKGGDDKHDEGTATKTRHQVATNKGKKVARYVPARDKVLGGYFYACVTLGHTIFLDGKLFQRLQLVHQRLRYLFPEVPRDLPTHAYLASLTRRLFPCLTPDQQTDLQTKALGKIYAAARQGVKAPKRSLICCSLLAVATEAGQKVSKQDLAFLMNFDCHHKRWGKVKTLLDDVSGSVARVSEKEKTRLEKLMNKEEPLSDPGCDLLKMDHKKPAKRRGKNKRTLKDKRKRASSTATIETPTLRSHKRLKRTVKPEPVMQNEKHAKTRTRTEAPTVV